MKTFFRIAVGCFALIGLLAVGFVVATNYRRIPAAWEYLKDSLSSDDAPTVVSRPVEPAPVPAHPEEEDLTGDGSCGESWVAPPREGLLVFEDARPVTNGIAAVMVEGKWGFIDCEGAWVTEPATSPYELHEAPWPRERVAELGEAFEVVEIGLTGAEELLVVDDGGRRYRVECNRFVPTEQALAVREVSTQPPPPPSGPYTVRSEGELTLVRVDERTAEERILVRYPYLGDWSIGTWAWAPDGERLYFDNHGAAACVWELDVETGELTKVVPEHGAERPRVAADTDGLRLYYLYDQAIWVAHRP